MGYTHYWTQRRDIGRKAWEEICSDVGAITSHAENVQGIALRDWSGQGISRPEFSENRISFNGANDDSHESFVIDRVRPDKETWQPRKGTGFCKTARKPYDVAVTAALCYLATVAEIMEVSSDGRGRDWLAGLEMARQALPRYANRLDIPLGVMADDRWIPPYPAIYAAGYDFRFCVDGAAYIMGPGGRSYRFLSHFEAAQWAATWQEKAGRVKNWRGEYVTESGPLFSPSGFFDESRTKRLASQQRAALAGMLTRATGERAAPPPAFVRPGELPAMDKPLEHFSIESIIAAARAAA